MFAVIMHQRIVTTDGQMQQAMNQGQVQQQVMEVQKTNVIVQSSGKHSVTIRVIAKTFTSEL